MTQEEKAKAYDKAIKRVEDIETGKCPKPFMFTEGLFDYIFPELKESEDEKIRKELVQFFKEKDEEDFEEWVSKAKVLSWLEKQGEQKPAFDIDIPFGAKDSELIEASYYIPKGFHAEIEGNHVVIKKGEQKPQGKTALEAIKEEKVDNANKVEPQDELTEFEKAVKQVMEEAIECGDTHNLKADADMLLNLAHNSSWSEEDETNLRRTEYAVMKFFGGDCSLVDWLRKSLKERYTWKLSDEQLKAQKGE